METLRGLGPSRLAAMALVAAGIFAFFIFAAGRFSSEDMALLYSELEAQDSGEIVGRLEQMTVPYRLAQGGSQIFVPRAEVDRVRVLLAESGLPAGGSIGYEIFDRSEGLGSSSFVQNVNHVRALEGELARTIRSIRKIRQARVHLVLPKRELFSRDRQEPRASIVVATQGQAPLSQQEVRAIQNLTAAAVPRLEIAQVTIVDTKGNLLARGGEGADAGIAAATADEMRIAYEQRLARAVEALLERSVGMGNVRAQVNADMDFDRITENAEIFDPEGQVVRSTQTVEEDSGSEESEAPPPVTVGANLPDAGLNSLSAPAGSRSSSTRNEETVNYEISKTVKTHVRETGAVRRLSIAVLVNGITTVAEDGSADYQPRSSEEMEQLRELVRSAIGFDEERGDTLKIVNMRFVDLGEELASQGDGGFLDFANLDLMRLAELAMLGLIAVLVLLLVVRPLLGYLLQGGAAEGQQPALAAAGAPAAITGPALQAVAGEAPAESSESEVVAQEVESMIDLNKVEGRVRASSVKKIAEIVDNHPEEAVAIIRQWLYQDS